MFFLHNIQKKQCLFFKGSSGPVAKTFEKSASTNICSVNTYAPLSSLHFGRGFGWPFHDHRNGLFAFFTKSVVICFRVFKLSNTSYHVQPALETTTRQPDDSNLVFGNPLSPAHNLLTLMVGNKYTERDATLSPTLVPAQLENADLLDAFPTTPPLPIRLAL